MNRFGQILAVALLLVAGCTDICFGQEIVFVNQRDELFTNDRAIVKVRIDGGKPVGMRLSKGKIPVDRAGCDTVAAITVEGYLVQSYHNQYTPAQFAEIDTVRLVQRFNITHQLPVLRLGTKAPADSVVKGSEWFLKIVKDLQYTEKQISLVVYNTEPLTPEDKEYIALIKIAYCKSIGMNERQVKIVYKQKPYTTGQEDFFNEGSIVTKDFITSQNTDWMQMQAQRYGIVMQVEVAGWNTATKK